MTPALKTIFLIFISFERAGRRKEVGLSRKDSQREDTDFEQYVSRSVRGGESATRAGNGGVGGSY